MLGYDRSGPEGQGPMTGRQMGKCNPDSPIRKGNDENAESTNVNYGRRRLFRRFKNSNQAPEAGRRRGAGFRGRPGRGRGRNW